MAYDRYDRDERSRWPENRSENRGENRSDDRFGSGRSWRGDDRGSRGERGFWDRASDEVASWFGDDEAERRRRQDSRRDERMGDSERSRRGGNRDWQHDREHAHNRDYDRGYGRDYDRDRSEWSRDQSSFGGGRSDRDFNYDRGLFNRGGSSDRDYSRGSQRDLWGARDWDEDRESGRGRSGQHGYRPMTGDYGRGTDH